MPKNREYHLHLPNFYISKKSKNTSLLYGVRTFRDLVNKIAIFFLPIFLYQQGASDPFWNFLPGNELQKGVSLLVLFYLVHRLTVLATGIEIGKLITKIGYQKAMLIGFALYGLFLSFLYLDSSYGWLVIFAALVNGLETNFFWNSYNVLISKFTLRKHMGQDLGLINFLLQLVQAIAPALGGLLIVYFGFSSLFLVGLVGILFCIIFLLQMKLKQERDVISWREFISWTKEKSFLRLSISQAGRYFNDAALVFWPLYIFLILGSVDRVGFLYTLSLFMAMMVSFGVGFYIDHHRNKKPFYISGGVSSLLWLLRSQVISFWQIAIIDTLDRLSANFYAIYYDAIAIKRGKGSQALSYFVYRELIVSVIAIIFWLVVGGLFLIFADPWLSLFILAAVGVLMGLLVKEHRSS